MAQGNRYPGTWFWSRLLAGLQKKVRLLCQWSPSPKKWRRCIHNATTQKWRSCQHKNDTKQYSHVYQCNEKVLYDLPEVFEDFLRAYAGLLVKVHEDSRVCLSRAHTKITMNTLRGTFTYILHSSRSRGIFLARCQWLFWTPPNLGFKETTRKTEYVLHRMPVRQLAIMMRKVWGKKSPWVGFASLPEPLREGEEW